jgi:hypothetical protein
VARGDQDPQHHLGMTTRPSPNAPRCWPPRSGPAGGAAGHPAAARRSGAGCRGRAAATRAQATRRVPRVAPAGVRRPLGGPGVAAGQQRARVRRHGPQPEPVEHLEGRADRRGHDRQAAGLSAAGMAAREGICTQADSTTASTPFTSRRGRMPASACGSCAPTSRLSSISSAIAVVHRDALGLDVVAHELRQRLHVGRDHRDLLAPRTRRPSTRAPALVTTGAAPPFSPWPGAGAPRTRGGSPCPCS